MLQALPGRAPLPHGANRPALHLGGHSAASVLGRRASTADGRRGRLLPRCPRDPPPRVRLDRLRRRRRRVRFSDVRSDGAPHAFPGRVGEPRGAQLEGHENRAQVRVSHVYQVGGWRGRASAAAGVLPPCDILHAINPPQGYVSLLLYFPAGCFGRSRPVLTKNFVLSI